MSKLKHVQLYENFQEGTPGGYKWVFYSDEDRSALGLVSNSDFERLVKANKDQEIGYKNEFGNSKHYYGWIPQVRQVDIKSNWVGLDQNGEIFNVPEGEEERYGIGPNGINPWNPISGIDAMYQVWDTSKIEPGTIVTQSDRYINGTFTVDEFISKYLNHYK